MIHTVRNFAVSLSGICALWLLTTGPIWAGHGDETATLNVGDDKLAIKGYDTVAYFTEGKAMMGSEEHQFMWQDATWNFATAQHRALFIANPEKYAPQYGAFCALGVTFNKAVPADPEAWTIVDGKLYMNYNLEFREKWRQEKAMRIEKGDSVWAEHVPAE